MNPVAIAKARQRLETARSYLNELGAAKSFAHFGEIWSRLLTSANSIVGVLSTGAMSNPRSRQWLGGKKRAIREDELLQYMHQARNVDEHGIEPTTKFNPGSFAIGGPGFTHIRSLAIQDGVIVHCDAVNEHGPAYPRFIPPHATTVAVRDDRYGTVFPVPTTHMGGQLDNQRPHYLAMLWLKWLDGLITEAASL